MNEIKSYKITKLARFACFSRFKRKVGSNNQLLITACIGLNKITSEDISDNKFPANWNPKDLEQSVKRSRELVLKSGLVWTIDCFDELLLECYDSLVEVIINDSKETEAEKKLLVDGQEISKRQYENIRRSVYHKYCKLREKVLGEKENIVKWREEEFKKRDSDKESGNGDKEKKITYIPDIELVFALSELAINWRNNLVHYRAQNPLSIDSRKILLNEENVKLLSSDIYGGCNINKMLDGFEKNSTPTFKEVAIMVRSIIDCGYILNTYWLNKINIYNYTITLLKELLPESIDEIEEVRKLKAEKKQKEKIKKNIFIEDKIKRYYKLKEVDIKKRRSKIVITLATFGYQFVDSPITEYKRPSDEDLAILDYLKGNCLIAENQELLNLY